MVESGINSVNISANNIKINHDDREALLNEILRKLSTKENFKNYFSLKYTDGSFIEFQNRLFNSEAFLYEVGRELYDIESQINTNYGEETKNNTTASSNNIRNNIVSRSMQKKEELSKTQSTQGFATREKQNVRANSNRHSKKSEGKNTGNDSNYFEPINFEKFLRSNNVKKTQANVTKKPFNRFINASSDKRKNTNKSGEIMNRSKSKEFYDSKHPID